MKKLILVLALSMPAFASPVLYANYEAVRQSFLTDKLVDVTKHAAALANEARAVNSDAIAALADAVAKAPDLAKARTAFGALSAKLIDRRGTLTGTKPAVYTCPMVKKDWLQPKGKVGNPYDASMVTCGTLKTE